MSLVRQAHFAWIRQNAVVLQGVTVGRDAVVGANSVVSQSVEEGALVVGVPARQAGLRMAGFQPSGRMHRRDHQSGPSFQGS